MNSTYRYLAYWTVRSLSYLIVTLNLAEIGVVITLKTEEF